MARSKDSGKEGAATRMKKSLLLLARLTDWPESWAIDDEDVPKGEELAAVLREFAQSLVEDGLAPSTISRHLSNLWLLGGEIIAEINFDPPLRRKKAAALLADAVDETGGPYSRHLDTEAEMRSFDATCKKLHKYLRARPDR